jgi:nicotinamidase-related amidase
MLIECSAASTETMKDMQGVINLHRPAGILGLVDSDYVVVLVSDCTSSSRGPNQDQQTVQTTFEDYVMGRAIGGYVAESDEIVWDTADEPESGHSVAK